MPSTPTTIQRYRPTQSRRFLLTLAGLAAAALATGVVLSRATATERVGPRRSNPRPARTADRLSRTVPAPAEGSSDRSAPAQVAEPRPVRTPAPPARPAPQPELAEVVVLERPAGLSERAERFFRAIAQVESYDGRVLRGDNGRSLGPYHIGREYWREACRFGGVDWNYRTRVYSRRHCRQVMTWYWLKWCPSALERGDLATLARVHNGGPRGYRKRATLEYWRRVRRAMSKLERDGL